MTDDKERDLADFLTSEGALMKTRLPLPHGFAFARWVYLIPKQTRTLVLPLEDGGQLDVESAFYMRKSEMY